MPKSRKRGFTAGPHLIELRATFCITAFWGVTVPLMDCHTTCSVRAFLPYVNLFGMILLRALWKDVGSRILPHIIYLCQRVLLGHTMPYKTKFALELMRILLTLTTLQIGFVSPSLVWLRQSSVRLCGSSSVRLNSLIF